MSVTLWAPQEQMLGAIREVYRRKVRRALLVSPTGSGKTIMFSAMTQNHLRRPGAGVLILVHRQELTQQVSDTLAQFDVPHGFIAAGFPERMEHCNVASVQTLARRLTQITWRPSLIIIDEAHHAVADTWDAILKHFAGVHVLGVTATPCRLSGEGLGHHFDELVLGPTTQQLIDQQLLSPFRVFCPAAPDLTGIRRTAGDFSKADLTARMNRPSVTGNALQHYVQHTPGRQAAGFCASVEHAHAVAEEFKKAGYQAACLDGSMPTEWRRQMVADYKRRELKVLTSCDLISEGFDCPGIEVVIMLRPSQSLALVRQQIGRGLRIFPGKQELVILDAAGNIERHQLMDCEGDRLVITEPQWSLTHKIKRPRDAESASPVRVCPECWVAGPSSKARCQGCGFTFPIAPRKVAKKKGFLEELTPEDARKLREKRERAMETGMANTLETLTELGRKRGYKAPERWAQHVLAGKLAKAARKRRDGNKTDYTGDWDT